MRSSPRASSILAAIVVASGCHRIVGIEEPVFVDGGAPGPGGDEAGVDANVDGGIDACPGEAGSTLLGDRCANACECPELAVCIFEDDTVSTFRVCCRLDRNGPGAHCGSNCDCASGQCDTANSVCL